MIIYKNIIKHKKLEAKNKRYNIFAGDAKNVCKSAYNLVFENQTLKTGLGFQDLKVPASETNLSAVHGFNFAEKIDDIKSIWMYRRYNTMLQTYKYNLTLIDSNNVLWYAFLIDPFNGFVFEGSDRLSSFPTYVCVYRIDNEDSSLYFTEQGMLYWSDGAEAVISNVPAMISCVVHYDNFFGITTKDRNTLIYTKNLNLKHWTDEEGSTIEFLDNRGSFTKLIVFNDYVYLFRENGITKISVYTSKSDFSFTHLYTSTSKIYEESICVCGEKVLFLTRDGLYAFNGNSVDKVASKLDDYIQYLNNKNLSGACLDGKYYIATRCDFADDDVVGCESGTYDNNVVFALDVETLDFMLYRGVDVRKLLAVDTPYYSKMVACFNGDNHQRIGQLDFGGTTFEDVNQKVWKSQETDLGYAEKRKRIKEFSILSQYPIDVQIVSDEGIETLHILGDSKQQKIPVNICGKTFQFNFSTTQNYCNVKKPYIAFDVQA